MKTKEEYRQSIFAKRDALLAKRKNNIRIAITSLGIAICICSVFTAKGYIDKNNNIIVDEDKLAAETTADVIENLTFEEAYNKPVSEPEETHVKYFGASSTKICVTENLLHGETVPATESADSMAGAPMQENTTVHKAEPNGNLDGVEAEAKPEDGNGSPDLEESPNGDDNTERVRYTEKDIIEEAKKYLTDEEKEEIIPQDTNVIVKHYSTGEADRIVYFRTDTKTITVTLKGKYLKFISKGDSTNKDTVQTTPAFNPELKNN